MDVPLEQGAIGAVLRESAEPRTQMVSDIPVGQDSDEPVLLVEIVEAALDAVRPQALANQIEIETDLSAAPIVLGDARRLEQVVWNLLWNAVKFTQPSGRVTVRLMRAGSEVVLSVADTGVGISSAFLPYVFEWFRQADAKSRSQSGR